MTSLFLPVYLQSTQRLAYLGTQETFVGVNEWMMEWKVCGVVGAVGIHRGICGKD